MLKVILAFGRWFVQGGVGFDGYKLSVRFKPKIIIKQDSLFQRASRCGNQQVQGKES